MQIELAYGKRGMTINVPDENLIKVLSMKPNRPVGDPQIALIKSLLQPIGCAQSLFDMAKGNKSACILICDITRPVPSKVLLPTILKTMHAAGLRHEDILILIAAGTNRANTKKEIVEIVGPEIASNYRIENHDAYDLASHRNIGRTARNTNVWLDHRYLDCDLKIATGLIEPHILAGFSGGRETIVPGIASIETIRCLHGPQVIENPNARENVLDKNPFHEEILEMAKMAGVDFTVNVALNEEQQITGIFSGDLELSYAEGVQFVRDIACDTINEPADVVVTTAAGYPLDSTWYQAIKGIVAASAITKAGGTIILATQCSNGIESDDFRNIVTATCDLNTFVRNIQENEDFVPGQWQLEKYLQAAAKAHIWVVSSGLKKMQNEPMPFKRAKTVEEALAFAFKQHGKNARIAVVPHGPSVIAEIDPSL
jgi:nickel-dependent lactate racemase